MKRLILSSVLCLFLSSSLFAVEFRRASPTLSDVHAATCRVRVSNARGTGIFNGYNATTGKAYISTNDHVTSVNRTCALDFWTNSKMESVQGVVVYKSRNDNAGCDFSIIEVDADALKKIDPPFVPMKALDANQLVGRTFLSSGCPDGRFDQGWRGTIERVEGGMAIFSPPPVPGQSGSGICVVDSGKVYDVAKLTYLLGAKGLDESKGGALPLSNLVSALGNNRASLATRYEVIPVADDGVRVLAFTSTDCPACVLADDGLTMAEHADGVPVERVDAMTEEGGKRAAKYRIEYIPCYVVVDANGKEQSRATPDEISRLGSRRAVTNAWTRAKVLATPKSSSVPGTTENEVETPELLPPAPAEDATKTYKLGDDNGIVVSSPGEVEKTIAVYITDPASYDFDAERVAATTPPSGLLKDLLERNDDTLDETPSPSPIIPRRRNENETERDSLSTRALDAFVDRLGTRIDKTVDGAFVRAETALNDAKKDVVQTIGDKIQTTWKTYRRRLVVLMFFVVFLAVVVARALSSFLSSLFERLKRGLDVLRAANAAARTVIKEAKEK